MSANKRFHVTDPLYGSLDLDDGLMQLVRTPAVQRLRHVRMSNIDSVNLPSIANMSRYEHVIGVAYLATQVSAASKLTRVERLALGGAALLHDWAITAFGHLMEEALQYAGTRFNHERKLQSLMEFGEKGEVLGAELQVFVGRQSGIRTWANSVVGVDSVELLSAIRDAIIGKPPIGGLIASDMDLDNIDNVYRMAFHMGLVIDKSLPEKLARAIVDVDIATGQPIFRASSINEVNEWMATRRAVYQRLMLSFDDFIGKLMMIYAVVAAFKSGDIAEEDWHLSDHELLGRLTRSSVSDVRETVQRWLVGELWDFTGLFWIQGKRPSFPDLLGFSRVISERIGRECFAYGIKDKRTRSIKLRIDTGESLTIGKNSNQWLFGLASPKRSSFRASDLKVVLDCARQSFGGDISSASFSDSQPWLL